MAFRFAPHYHLQARVQQAASITINYSIYNIHVSYSDKAPYYFLWELFFFFPVYPESFFGLPAIQTHISVHWNIIVELNLNYQPFLKSEV